MRRVDVRPRVYELEMMYFGWIDGVRVLHGIRVKDSDDVLFTSELWRQVDRDPLRETLKSLTHKRRG